jgi:hypothetical protein
LIAWESLGEFVPMDYLPVVALAEESKRGSNYLGL